VNDNKKLLKPAMPALLLAASALLAACGGGGASYTPPAPTPAPVPVPVSLACSFTFAGDSTIAAGKTASASVLPTCAGTLRDVVWSQVSGPVLTLLDTRSPTIALESSQPGVVTLKAELTLADGTTVSNNTSVTFTAAPAGSYLTVRADHSVREGVDTSVRAWPTLAAGETLASISWTQVAGPTVSMDTTDNRLLMFTSPTVPASSVGDIVPLTFRAVMLTSSGRQDSDDVTISVERSHNAKDVFFESAARMHPYRPAATYAGALQRCTYDTSLYYTDNAHNSFCTAATLPLIDTEAGFGNMPTVAQIMGRVLVSHDFLGANFEQFLTTQDPNGDLRRLLAGVNAIVIGSHVRPSFYQSATGAIYLDADNFWLTPQQRDVVTEVPDYRSSFGSALSYTGLGRMIKNNDYARRSFPATARNTRDIGELIYHVGDLLYHELGHASDFFSPADRTLNPAVSIWENVVSRIDSLSLPSDALAKTYPLKSQEMLGLGQVLYRGATATAVQNAYTAADVGRFFGGDDANDDYAYSINGSDSSREDLAMLMEEFWMSYRHGVQFDVAYSNKFLDGMTSRDLILAWGQRGRIADPAVKPRIKLMIKRIAPWIDPAVVDTLPATIQMQSGKSWADTVVLTPGAANTSASMKPLSPEAAAKRLHDDIKRARH
jgi:hypothetical protein